MGDRHRVGRPEVFPAPRMPLRRIAVKALVDGGPSTCHFAITSICNARCEFCNFAIDRLPRHEKHSVTLAGAKLALDILARNNVRYLHLTGGEPLVHPKLDAIVRSAHGLSMSTVLVINGRLLSEMPCR